MGFAAHQHKRLYCAEKLFRSLKSSFSLHIKFKSRVSLEFKGALIKSLKALELSTESCHLLCISHCSVTPLNKYCLKHRVLR